jgi:hypothetical protein
VVLASVGSAACCLVRCPRFLPPAWCLSAVCVTAGLVLCSVAGCVSFSFHLVVFILYSDGTAGWLFFFLLFVVL